MIIEKCDICKKEIKKDDAKAMASFGTWYLNHTFCADCGKPISKFLKKHKLIKTK